MKVKARRVFGVIHRDMAEEIATIVPEHEVELLEVIHGEGNWIPKTPDPLDVEANAATKGTYEIDVREEYDRLAMKYGNHPERAELLVDAVYGRFSEPTYAAVFSMGDRSGKPSEEKNKYTESEFIGALSTKDRNKSS